MSAGSDIELTLLLKAWSAGDQKALEELVPHIQRELHRLASRYMAGERANHPLQTTALMNEAYIRLIEWKNVQWQNRAHFFAVAAQMMRRILVDAARAREGIKRSVGTVKTAWTDQCRASPSDLQTLSHSMLH